MFEVDEQVLAIGSVARNRLIPVWNQFFGFVTTYNAAITAPDQFDAFSTSNSFTPKELDNAAKVFTGTHGESVANAGCFFSPDPAGWPAIQVALQSGTTTLPIVNFTPACYGLNKQFVVKLSIEENNRYPGTGTSAFVFVQERYLTQPAVIPIP